MSTNDQEFDKRTHFLTKLTDIIKCWPLSIDLSNILPILEKRQLFDKITIHTM